jgi:AraC-like DNA-binding protein
MKEITEDSSGVQFRTDDRDAFVDMMAPVSPTLCIHPLSTSFAVEACVTRVGPAGLFWIRMPNTHIDGGAKRDYVSVTMPLAGDMLIDVDGRLTEFGPGRAHIQRPDDPFFLRTLRSTARVLVADVDRTAVEDELRRRDLDPASIRNLSNSVRLASQPGAVFYNAFLELWSLSRSLTARDNPTLGLLEAERALTSTLVSAAGLTATSATNDVLSRHRVARVEEFIAANLKQAIGLSDLAALAGVRAETLCRAFQKRHGVGPIRYLRQRRLEAAHQELVGADPTDQSVSQISARYGFVHLSQFALQYRRVFGERPSKTLAS